MLKELVPVWGRLTKEGKAGIAIMKFFHLSDLHIGRQLGGYSLMENQKCVLTQIYQYAKELHPDAVLISGDVYDKTTPSGEAFLALEDFLQRLSKIRPAIPVLVIAGNHDSRDRLAYASSFLEQHSIYISTMPPQKPREFLKRIRLEDGYGPVNFYLLPFFKPSYVRSLWEKEEQEEAAWDTYEGTARKLLEREEVNDRERNVILSHQFYMAGVKEPELCESEHAVWMAGGLDRIDASVLKSFDYAALGHLHGSQQVGAANIRYCGTPYKYSISEEHHKKSITVVELKEKGEPPLLSFLPLQGFQEVRKIRGTLKEVLAQADETGRHDFVYAVLTDEKEPYRIRERLEEVYDHLLGVEIDNERTRSRWEEETAVEIRDPMDAFRKFYQLTRNSSMSAEEEEYIKSILEAMGEEEEE